MTDRLCPFDKKSCIGSKCMVFLEDSGTCAFRSIGIPAKRGTPAARKSEDGSSSKRFSAHLFD
jgi:hypothetical protein